MKLVIADTKSYNKNGKSTGHYFAVAKNYQEALEDYFQVEVAGGPIYSMSFGEYQKLRYDSIEGKSGIINKLHTIQNTVQVINNNEDAIIILQSNAVVTTFLGLLFSKHHPQIYSIQYNLMALDSPLKKGIYRLAKNRIKGILCPRDDIGKAYDKPYCVVPDYYVTQTKIDKNMIESGKEYDIGIVGIITEDKGVIKAIEVLCKTSLSVVIAGSPANEDIRKRIISICKDYNNIKLVLDYISEEEYDKYIRVSRYCVLNYSEAYSNHSSGVVYDILYRGTPIIGRRCGFLDFIEENRIGYLYKDIQDFEWKVVRDENAYQNIIKQLKVYLANQIQETKKLAGFLVDIH